MDKPPVNNAFTLMEALLTLLIISLLTLISLKPSISHLEYFSRKMAAYSVLTQEKAFIAKENKDVRIEKDRAYFADIEFQYPPSISCTPFAFHYNAKGSISQAHTIQCTDKDRTIHLIYQLGSGRVRIE